ncbi:MAG: helix-turn-helix transcriptional regulator [Oscillospiraceae bacterium]|nr:helix-turn-helix transcriptional regulator [Oscillospiraceae bacterium]
MKMKDKLEQYLSLLGCTSQTLSEVSGVSPATVSRYCSGSFNPKQDSPILKKLAKGIAELSRSRHPKITAEQVLRELQECCTPQADTGSLLAENFNILVNRLNINLTALSDFSNFNLSYLYRIRSGERKPRKTDDLRDSICRYIARYHNSETEKTILSRLTGREITDDRALYDAVRDWLYADHSGEMHSDTAEHFLTHLDNFDLREYIRAFSFGAAEIQKQSPVMPAAQRYYGLERFKEAELDFIASVLLSETAQSVRMCSDMPMRDMAADPDFGKKWMTGLVLLMKKGIRLEVIHDLDRPFEEMMYGLAGWIPLYMTGQVSPFYFKSVRNGLYRHLLYSAEHSALRAECLTGFHEDGCYELETAPQEVAYCRKRAKELFRKASPLMEIYREDSAAAFRKLEDRESEHTGQRRRILTVPPIYTLSDELLQRILNRCGVPEVSQLQIRQYVSRQRLNTEKILQHSSITDELPELKKEEFEAYPQSLSLSGMFYPDELQYTFEEYQAHLRLTQEYAKKHEGYTLLRSTRAAFRNIQIRILLGGYVIIAKNKYPMIQFVIRHRSLCDAIEHFEVRLPDENAKTDE